ncbi:CheB methylesterase domain-containing protein [Bacillus sp. FSL K6-3431]|uniref:CheB methylesterase domain-containing protein n=1 Tax=Bacillus sp. FSL K6-3431 TaxID=2921500 RepID=UPI0030F9927B
MKHPTFFLMSDSAVTRVLYGKLFENSTEVDLLGAARFNETGINKMIRLASDFVIIDLDREFTEVNTDMDKIQQKYHGKIIIILSKEQEQNNLSAGTFDIKTEVSFFKRYELIDIKSMEAFKNKLIQFILSEDGPILLREVGQDDEYVQKKLAVRYAIPEIKLSEQLPLHIETDKKIICIGTSTGGPRALQTVLSQLPKSINAPIVIVQHMPPSFTYSLAKRLNSICNIEVKEAEDGERLKKGTAYIAPGGHHMTIHPIREDLIVKITGDPPVNGHRPSVDVMFNSLSFVEKYAKIAVIMTGMGADGSSGLLRLKKSGMTIAIAESEQTCIVYGMPKAAIGTGGVDEVLKIEDIASNILKYMKGR